MFAVGAIALTVSPMDTPHFQLVVHNHFTSVAAGREEFISPCGCFEGPPWGGVL